LYNLTTFKVLCSSEGAHGKLIGEKTLKSPEDSDDYVHVIKSKMDETELIVKVQEKGRLLNRELEIQDILQNQNNVIKFVCSFECNFDRLVWDKPLEAPRTFCDKTGDTLTLVIMEYINNDLADFLESGDYTDTIIISILKQIGLALFEIHFNYGISHNDLNRGNILLDINTPKTISYKSGALNADVETYGHEVVLIDFQRSTISKTKNPRDTLQYAIDEISLAYDIISRWAKTTDLREYIQSVMNNVMNITTKRGLFTLLTSIEYKKLYSKHINKSALKDST
jgi:serine/threonine protein kinase